MILGGETIKFLRHNEKVLEIVRGFDKADKFIFSIRHGIQILTAADLVKNKPITYYENLRFEVEACGDNFVGKSETVREGKYVSGQTLQSHPDFYRLSFECLKEKKHFDVVHRAKFRTSHGLYFVLTNKNRLSDSIRQRGNLIYTTLS